MNPELVKEARKAEMEYFRKMGVYTKVSKKRCYDVTERAPVGVRWVDINKQDDASPLCRSRLVAKDFNKGKDPDLYTQLRRWNSCECW